MTVQEAINILQYDQIISDEVINLAIKALQKQVPKKPSKESITQIISGSVYPFEKFYCPNCREEVYCRENSNCNKCGQRLDWSDEI